MYIFKKYFALVSPVCVVFSVPGINHFPKHFVQLIRSFEKLCFTCWPFQDGGAYICSIFLW